MRKIIAADVGHLALVRGRNLLSTASFFALTACGFAGEPVQGVGTPGFFVGVWNGLLAPWTLFLRFFIDIHMYAIPNSGWFYDAGFLIGVAFSLPIGWAAAIIQTVIHIL